MPSILIIAEGEGDIASAPVLCRRLLGEFYGNYEWTFVTHRRGGISHLRGSSCANFKRFLQAGFMERMPILWMLDNDENICARTLIQEFYDQAAAVGVQQPVAFALWTREYETMFLYDPEFIAAKLGIPDIDIPEEPESRRGVKELLNKQMPTGFGYKERINQPSLTAGVNLVKLRENYESFQHFERALLWLTKQERPELYPLRT